jgi:hypothetical protein
MTAVKELTDTIAECLTSKMNAGFQASSKLTIDIARILASELEFKATRYTDEQIDELLTLMDSTDLTPFKDFMDTLKEVLGEESGNYRTIEKLMLDTKTNHVSVINLNSTIVDITLTITGINNKVSILDDRLRLLETDTLGQIDASDDVIVIFNAIITNACNAAKNTLQAYTEINTSKRVHEVQQLMKTNVFANVRLTETNNLLLITGQTVHPDAKYVRVTFPNTEMITVNIANNRELSVTTDPAIFGYVKLQAFDISNASIGDEIEYQWYKLT